MLNVLVDSNTGGDEALMPLVWNKRDPFCYLLVISTLSVYQCEAFFLGWMDFTPCVENSRNCVLSVSSQLQGISIWPFPVLSVQILQM